jgi:uncharacterized glyoxalase superfamily protein PhnB
MNVTCRCCEKSVEETNAVRLLHDSNVTICFDCLGWLDKQRDRHDRAHSGGWVVTSHDSIFVVADVQRAVEHYRKLGFEVRFYDEGYAFAEHGSLSIHLQQAAENGMPPGAGVLYIHCDDADAVAAEWRKAGLEVVAPENKPWGKYEGAHVDPDGNLIRFGSPPRR